MHRLSLHFLLVERPRQIALRNPHAYWTAAVVAGAFALLSFFTRSPAPIFAAIVFGLGAILLYRARLSIRGGAR